MDKEIISFSAPEQKETGPKTYHIRFDQRHFNEIEQSLDTVALVEELNIWWDNICIENGVDPREESWSEAGYHILELAKNSLEYGGSEGGEITVVFEPKKIKATISDKGEGFENQEVFEYYSSPEYGHGLHEVREYADEFLVESGGKKYATENGGKELFEVGDSDVTVGAKISFTKNLG